jgi:CRISPR system Cascade subunit CasA
LLAVALVQNPELGVANARVAAAHAAEIVAGERPNPDLTLESEYARHDTHPWLYGLALDWPLTSPSQRRVKLDIARLATESERLQRLEEAWSLRRRLVEALSQWQTAGRQIEVAEQLALAEDQLVAITRARVAAGEDAPAALVALEQTRMATETERVQLRERAAAAQSLAAAALGVVPAAMDEIRIDWPDWGSPPPLAEDARAGARERALLSRSDLELAIDDYAVAEKHLELAVARQYPQLAIGPGYYWDHGIAKFPFDVGVSLPLNRNRGEIAEARAARDVAGRHMLAVQADILGAIDAAERGEQLAREGVAAAERLRDTARRAALSSDRERIAGAAGRDQAVLAGVAVLRAELGVLDARAELQSARDRLEDALHTPLSGPEMALAGQ